MLDVAIIGCGVVGAAAAYELSHYPLHTAIFEAENDVADCTTKPTVPFCTLATTPNRAPGWRGSTWRGPHWPRRSAPGWMCRTCSAAVWCWPSARKSCPTCRNCMRTASPTACRASGCFPQRKRLPWNRIWPPLSLARCMRQRRHRQPVGVCAGNGRSGCAQRRGAAPQLPVTRIEKTPAAGR